MLTNVVMCDMDVSCTWSIMKTSNYHCSCYFVYTNFNKIPYQPSRNNPP
eukprot:UN00880